MLTQTDPNDHSDYRNDPIEVDNEVICFGSRQLLNLKIKAQRVAFSK